MRLKFKPVNLISGRPIAFLDVNFAKKLNIVEGGRIEVVRGNKKLLLVCNLIGNVLTEKEISLSKEANSYLRLKKGDEVVISMAFEPRSTKFILKKMNKQELSREEIFSIVNDIVDNSLNEAEIAYFVSGVYENGMSFKEIVQFTESMAKTGETLDWNGLKIADKHCIGGVAGNRTTPIVVSICASAGVVMPKTSSRAITSAAGTADVMETVTNVSFSYRDLKKIVKKTGACLAWGGSLGLAPADDKIIRVERLLNVDPEANFISSILAKKISVGSKYVLIDIPCGEGAKVSVKKARDLGKTFVKVGKRFGMKIEFVLTEGSEPIGNGVGPVLEMIDVLKVLRREGAPMDLEKKSIFLAGKILESGGKAKKGKGMYLAREILDSKRALEKFEEIISAQGKKKNNLIPGRFSYELKAVKNGTIKHISNKSINFVARVLGCPTNKTAGIYLHKKKGDSVEKDDVVLTLYSESKRQLNEGIEITRELKPVVFN